MEVSEAVLDIWGPTEENLTIINPPSTVRWRAPNIFADQIEWMGK